MRDRWHKGAGHNYFLTGLFCATYWVPFLKAETIEPTSATAEPPQLWVRAISVVRLKYVAAAAAVAVLFTSGAIDAAGSALNTAFRDREKELMIIHRFETPRSEPLDYKMPDGRVEKIVVDIYANADIAVSFLRDLEWVEFRKERFKPPINALAFLIPAAYAQSNSTQVGLEEPESKRVSIVSGCSFLCVKQNSYTFRLLSNLTAEILERDDNGLEVSRSARNLHGVGDVFLPLRLRDLYVGLDARNSRSRKEINFRKAAGVPEAERLVALVNATVFGSGVNGIAFGEKGVYVNTGWPDAPFYFPYSELLGAEIRVGRTSYEVMVGKREISIPGSSFDAYQLSSVLELLKIIGGICGPSDRQICQAFR